MSAEFETFICKKKTKLTSAVKLKTSAELLTYEQCTYTNTRQVESLYDDGITQNNVQTKKMCGSNARIKS